MIDILIKNGADVDAVDQNGWTPLFYAVANSGDEKIIEQLVKNNANINRKDNNETANIHSATFLGKFVIFAKKF